MRLLVPVAEADHAALTPWQRRMMKPRDQAEKAYGLRLMMWTVAFSSLLLLTPINRQLWLAIDVTLMTAWFSAYAVCWGRRMPKSAKKVEMRRHRTTVGIVIAIGWIIAGTAMVIFR